MKISEEVLFHLLHAAFYVKEDFDFPSSVEWKKVAQLAYRQDLIAIAYDGIQNLYKKNGKEGLSILDDSNANLNLEWISLAENVVKTCREQRASAAGLAKIWHEKGIRTLILKGMALSRAYPEPDHRPCNDLDCFLCGKYEEGNQVVEELGIEVDREDYRHSTFQYKMVHVENHRICTTVRGKKKRRRFEAYLQSLLKEGPSERLDETYLEVPSPLFNALYFLQHAQRHFLREGISLRFITDWAMMIHCFEHTLDPRNDEGKHFWQVCKENGLTKFAESMTRLAFVVCGIRAPWLDGEIALLPQDRRLLDDCYMLSENAIQYGNNFKAHLQIVKNMYKQRWKYRYFSEDSFLRELFTSVWGVFFERNPKIEEA